MEPNSGIKSFFEGWQLYRLVIEHNYMVHDEIIEWLLPRFDDNTQEGLRVLELGCGDAYTITKIAKSNPIKHFTGVDLSQHALEFAAENLSQNVGSYQLISGDMSKVILDIDQKFDVILASYSIHHLQASIKQKLFADINKRLAPNGKFFMIDIIKYEEEERLDYLNRANDWYSSVWNQLSKDQLHGVYEHTLSSDFPESFGFFKDVAEKTRLICTTSEYLDSKNLFGAMEFLKINQEKT